MWNNIHEKKYYDISDRLDKIKYRISNDFFSSTDYEYDSKPNFSDIIYKIVSLRNATQAKNLYERIMESMYLSSVFKDISENDLIYYAEEKYR